jgi:hypothetical protein
MVTSTTELLACRTTRREKLEVLDMLDQRLLDRLAEECEARDVGHKDARVVSEWGVNRELHHLHDRAVRDPRSVSEGDACRSN